jgi:hypothetical protein
LKTPRKVEDEPAVFAHFFRGVSPGGDRGRVFCATGSSGFSLSGPRRIPQPAVFSPGRLIHAGRSSQSKLIPVSEFSADAITASRRYDLSADTMLTGV